MNWQPESVDFIQCQVNATSRYGRILARCAWQTGTEVPNSETGTAVLNDEPVLNAGVKQQTLGAGIEIYLETQPWQTGKKVFTCVNANVGAASLRPQKHALRSHAS
jgi:hypothetical protein